MKVGIKINRAEIFKSIELERDRQDKLHPVKKAKKSENKEIDMLTSFFFSNEMLSILVEEVGEVGKALQGDGNLEEELIQCASVCIKWLEHLE